MTKINVKDFVKLKKQELKRTKHQTEDDVRSDLAILRIQLNKWDGKSHVFDGPDCILCGCFGPIDGGDPCKDFTKVSHG